MINVAIVEDEARPAEVIQSYLEKYSQERELLFHWELFKNAEAFLESKDTFQIVLMDIELPGMNGLDACRALRKTDQKIIIIFVTNLAQMAITGYEVDALDFIVKPVVYNSFSLKFDRAIHRVDFTAEKYFVMEDNSKAKILLANIYYVEVMGHTVIFHTVSGNIETKGMTMKAVESKLPKDVFFKCNNCYLVNLEHVSSIEDHAAIINGESLRISYPRYKDFVQALSAYLGR